MVDMEKVGFEMGRLQVWGSVLWVVKMYGGLGVKCLLTGLVKIGENDHLMYITSICRT